MMTNQPKFARLCALVLVFVLVYEWSATAQQPTIEDLKKQLDTLTEGMKAIQKELQELKTMVARPAATAPSGLNVVLDLADNQSKGADDAALTLVEFTDYQCPFCSRHVRDTWPKLDAEYIQTGKIRYVLLDLPLESIHKQAFKAAEAANCAGEQAKFWEMHDRLFQHQRALEPWSTHAEAIGLDVAAFNACLDSDKYSAEIRRDMGEARKLGIGGTPGFVLARNEAGSRTRVRTVAQLKGAQPFEAFKAEIDRQLAVISK